MSGRLIARFNNWFSSDNGVIHTLIATAIIVILELAVPGIDPHGFWLLFWLTVYSAVTQPALANTGRHSDERLERLEKHQMEQQDRIEGLINMQLLWMERLHEALTLMVRKEPQDPAHVSDPQ